jgi:hypothetical protein
MNDALKTVQPNTIKPGYKVPKQKPLINLLIEFKQQLKICVNLKSENEKIPNLPRNEYLEGRLDALKYVIGELSECSPIGDPSETLA